jgi:hypothetical protein
MSENNKQQIMDAFKYISCYLNASLAMETIEPDFKNNLRKIYFKP